MLIAEEDLIFLPQHTFDRVMGKEVIAYLWQHCLDEYALDDLAHIHYPLLPFDQYKALSTKRKLERLSIDMLASQLLGYKIRILHKESGEPYLNNSQIRISISHTNNLYCLSLAKDRHGMDVEQWGVTAYKVKSKFLTADEESLISYFLPQMKTKERAATLLWSAKEAAYKFIATKGVQLLRDIHLTIDSHENLQATFSTSNEEQTTLIRYELYPACVLTYCTIL